MAGEDIVLLTYALLPALLAVALFLFRRFGLHRKSPRLPCLLLGNALVLLLLVSLVLLGGEVYYRFVYDGSESFGVTNVNRKWYVRHWRTNLSGFRDDVEYRQQPPPQHRRVTFLGDSVAAGYGIPNVDDRFADRIRHGRETWEIHVMARCGWNTLEQVQTVDALSKERYALDRVVLVYSLNDLGPFVPGCQDVFEQICEVPVPGLFLREGYFLNLYYHRLVLRSDPKARGFFDHLREGYEGEPWQRHRQLLGQLVQLVRSHGGQFSVVTFPCLQVGVGEGEFRPVHETLRSFWRSLGVPHLDMAEVFRGHDREDLVVSAHDGHPNETAHALASEAIVAFLESRMRR